MRSDPGTYALVLHALRAEPVCIGRLGRLEVQPGFYAYVGSALGPGGVAARVHRHARGSAARHWHVDHLRVRTRLVEAWYTHASEALEHVWAAALASMRAVSLPLPGFGSSDCTCRAHLFFFATRPSRERLRRALRVRIPNHPALRTWRPASSDPAAPDWAPRIPQAHVARLYAADARGIRDEALIGAIGHAFLARCQSILAATEASRGRAPCPVCRATVPHAGGDDSVMRCRPCGWRGTWRAYKRSYQRKQLHAGGMEPFFRDYVEQFPRARTARERMLLIDALLHRFHRMVTGTPTRPGAVNLIQGRMTEVIRFLDRLTYGDAGTEELRANRVRWREELEAARRIWPRYPG